MFATGTALGTVGCRGQGLARSGDFLSRIGEDSSTGHMLVGVRSPPVPVRWTKAFG
jgi:hypothetical protein